MGSLKQRGQSVELGTRTLPGAGLGGGVVLQRQLLHADGIAVRVPKLALGAYAARDWPPLDAHLHASSPTETLLEQHMQGRPDTALHTQSWPQSFLDRS